MIDWPPTTLGDLISVKHGWPFKSKHFSESLTGRPIVVNIGNFEYTGGFRFGSTTVKEYRDDYPKEYELSPGEILLVMTCQTSGGEILGIPARIPDDGRVYLHNQRLGRVIIKNPRRIDSGFLYWLFLWSEFNRELFVSSTGTKILHTAPNRIERFTFDCPPIGIQRRIADILGSLDDKIELNRRMNCTLEAMVRRLFRSWFVDFDPVHAKAAVRREHPNWDNARISREALPKLDSAIAEAFPDDFEESELGQIPKGWRVGTVGDVADNPKRTTKPAEIEPDTPYIALEHIPRRQIGLNEWTVADGVASGKYRFNIGEILFGKLRPYFHKVGVAPLAGVCSTDILVIVPSEPAWRGFALGHISCDEMIFHTDGASTGTKMPRTNWNDIARYAIALPAPELAKAFDETIAPALEQLRDNVHEARRLAETRDKLLPRLLSGELLAQVATTGEVDD